MVVSPLEYRYGRNKVKSIFSEQNKLKYMLEVEKAVAIAEAEFSMIPREAAKEIAKVVDSGIVDIERVKEIESRIRHDAMAVVTALTEKCEVGGKYVHFGLTSNDVIDTSTALQLKDFYAILFDDLKNIQQSMMNHVKKYRDTPMLGRTHGQHASPITFGLKMAVYLAEINRHIERLLEAQKRILVGKVLGPVGTGASLGGDALEIQRRTMEILGLGVEEGSSQIVTRDRYVEYLSLLNGIVTSLEKFATEIRNLQRPEIDEVSEYFDRAKQVGSSSMPSKVNPIASENVVSIARLVRSFIIPEYEAAVTWHERDLTNSALERFTIPYSSVLTDHVLTKLTEVFNKLIVNADRMDYNLKSDQFILSESVVTKLTLSGVPRQDAHELVRKSSMEAYEQRIEFSQSLINNGILKLIDEESLEQSLNPMNFLGKSADICNEIVEMSLEIRKKLDGGN